jgi:hypothetical protein
MEISRAIDFLNDFRSKTENIKNKNHSEKFVRVLEEIKYKNFNELQIQRINSELNVIFKNFEIEMEKINVKNELSKFLRFLKSEFSIIIPNYNLYIGMLAGVLVSIFLGPLSILVGLLIGAGIGYFLDQKAEKEDRKLKTILDNFMC